MSLDPVCKQVLVHATPEHTFDVFRQGAWWPPQHTILASGSPRKELVIEPREGGRWYEVGEDGSQCDWGKVISWEPPRRVVLAWQINGNFEADASAMTEVEVNFIPEGNSTRVQLEHRGFERYVTTGEALRDAVGSDAGWGGLLKGLAATAEKPKSTSSRYFVCKLHTPRARFMEDMNEEEGAALGAHVGYWSGLVEKKIAVLFGPVGDPAGFWGLGVVAAAGVREAEQLAQADPAIGSGLGFRCEVFPMLRTVLATP